MTKAQQITQKRARCCSTPQCGAANATATTADNNNGLPGSNDDGRAKTSAVDMMKKGAGGSLAIVVPPDGGWGWVVVFAAFYCNVVVDGIIYSFGMLLTDMVNTFHESESKISIVGSLLNGFYLIAGPFVSALLNSVDFRAVTIVGSIISSIAFICAVYVKSLYQLMFCYGIVGGVGFSMIYVSAVLIPGFYFDKWRALATGISVCGSGIGTFVLAPLNAYLVRIGGWQTTIMVQAGLALSCGLVGILFRPLEPTIIEVPTLPNPVVMEPKIPEDEPLLTSKAAKERKMSLDSKHAKIGAPTVEEIYNHLSDRLTPEPQNMSISCHSLNTHHQYLKDKLSPPETPEKKLSVVSLRRPSLSAHLMDRDDRFFGGSLSRLPQYSSQVSSLNYAMSVTRIPAWNEAEEEEADDPSAKNSAFRKNMKKYYKSAMHTLMTMLDFSILSSPSFLVLTCSGFLTLLGFFVPFMYISEKAISEGMDKTLAVWLVSTTGITNTFGRVICGWISSYESVDPILVNNISLTFGGLYTMVLPLIPYSVCSYYLYASLFGFSMACFASLRSTMIVELTGLELLTNAFGVLLMFQGVAAAIGAPLLGQFKDLTGNYDLSFYLSGGILVASAVICYPLRRVKKWEDEKKTQRHSV